MKAAEQIPRHALIWIILSQFSLVAPHLQRIPIWILVIYIFTAIWRMQVYAGRWSFPGKLVKTVLILSSFFGIYLSFGSLIGLEPTVALLLTAFALKLIELATRKDAYVIIFLGYFVCVTEFLFSQDILVVFYAVLTVVLITAALISLHQPASHKFAMRPLRLAATMLAQSLPLMLVLFFIFPRIGPLWTVPIKSHTAKTGVSDFMRPGDISKLSRSSDVAFRVQFDGDIPAQSELYWRGLVFSQLEGDTWKLLNYYDTPAEHRKLVPAEKRGEPISYRIIMKPTQQNWIYGLRYAESPQAKVMQSNDFRLFSPVELEDEYRYSVTTWPDTLLEPEMSQWRRDVELKLPEQLNPRTRELGSSLRTTVNSDRAFVDLVLARFNTQGYVYTLQPPPLGANGMDEFLFESRRGFCEHFAYAFVVLMRAGGVPSRVVAGYQGGEINPVNSTIIVHQFDAHAWAEVWFEDQGWVRVDPTGAVAPDRIELGLEQAMAGEGSFLADSPLSPLRYRGVLWLNSLRLSYDALTWRWQSLIVGYDGERQFEFLENILGEFSAKKFALILLGSWALVLIPVSVSLLARRSVQSLRPEDRKYLQFCRRLENLGLRRELGEAPGQFAERAAQRMEAAGPAIRQITRAYQQLAYADRALSEQERKKLLRLLSAQIRHLRLTRGRARYFWRKKNPA